MPFLDFLQDRKQSASIRSEMRDKIINFVLQGIVNVSNTAGSQSLSAGQYVYVQSGTAIPKILPGNPGIDFTLPASIADSPKGGGDAKQTDPGCIVR